MKLTNLCDDDLWKVSMLKTRKGTATSDALRAQQILRTRNITHGGFYGAANTGYDGTVYDNIGGISNSSTHDFTTGNYMTFEELNGCSLEEYLERRKKKK